MPELQPWKPGDKVTAKRLNQLNAASAEQVTGSGDINVTKQNSKVAIQDARPNRSDPNINATRQIRKFFINTSGEEKPAGEHFGLIASINDNGSFNIVKPTADSMAAGRLVITGPDVVENTKGSYCYLATNGGYVTINGVNPSGGDDFGTVSGQWYGEKDKTGFQTASVLGGRAFVGPFSDTSSRVSFGVTKVSLSESNFSNGTYYSAWKALAPNQNVVGILGAGSLIMIWDRRLDFEVSYIPTGAAASRATIDAAGIQLKYTDDSSSGLIELRRTGEAQHDAATTGTVSAKSFEHGLSKDLAGGVLDDKTIKEYRLYMTLSKANANSANASLVRGLASGNLIFINA